jgi:hypothetical protein
MPCLACSASANSTSPTPCRQCRSCCFQIGSDGTTDLPCGSRCDGQQETTLRQIRASSWQGCLGCRMLRVVLDAHVMESRSGIFGIRTITKDTPLRLGFKDSTIGISAWTEQSIISPESPFLSFWHPPGKR